jgi:hypothetical protein
VKASGPAKPTAVSAGVVEFRKKVWRHALLSDLEPQPRRCIELLIALALDGSARHIVAGEIATDKVQGLGNRSLNQNSMLDNLKALTAADGGSITLTVTTLSLTTLDSLSDEQIKQALTAYAVDLTKTFAVSADYLKLLTKTEIDAVAKEIGLEKAYGAGFAKLLSGKKDDAIKALMAVAGFNYHVVPAQLTYL